MFQVDKKQLINEREKKVKRGGASGVEWKTMGGREGRARKRKAVSSTALVSAPAWEGLNTANKPEAPCKFRACCRLLPSLVFVPLASSNRSLLETKAGIATVTGAQPITRSQQQALQLRVLLRSASQA